MIYSVALLQHVQCGRCGAATKRGITMAAKPKIMTNLAPTDHWSVKEKLCLASSVMRSGDQNWVSVSRAVKPFAEPAHQPEFFSQKNCAKQYSAMLENEDTPKRKRSSERSEVVETPGDLIVKKITLERIDELKAQIREDKVLFKQLKKDIDDIRSGSADDKLQDMWNEMQSKKKATEEEAEPSKPTTETVKSAKSSVVPTPGKSKRPTSRTSKTSRTSEGSEASAIDVIGKEDDGDSVFDPAASSDTITLSLTDKHKIETETQESNDSIGGAEGSDVDVTAVSDIKPGTSTLSKLLTKGKTSSSSSISPIEPPSQPSLSSASKASAAKEAAKILLSGAGASASEDVPKIDIDNTDSNKTLDVGEDSDSNIPTEPPSPSRPEPSETRGKRKSRGRPPASARRSGRTRARTQADGEDTSEERNQSRRPSDSIPDDDAREEARSETAESEETDRPSAESDRDDLSSVAAGSLQPSMFADSLPGSPSSVTTEHEHDHTYRIWRKAIMLVWRTIAAHKYANIFLHPVTNDIAPGYCSIVHRRTDLTKVKKSIENGTIRTTEQFYRDIMLMFQNAIMYNNRDHDVYQMAVSMQNDAMQYIEEFISTQLMVQQPDSVKMLRSKDGGSRRLDAPAKEETDRQRRGSSEIETSGKKRRTRADEL